MKIVFIQGKNPNTLVATVPVQPRGYETGIGNNDLDEMVAYCQEHNLGHRTSFDTFKFNTKEAMTMFLLKWN